MPDIIHLLPDSVANQIAAGEVIQRPASVVKELMENALDAGATYIQLIVKDAGKTLIQLIDNGSGMSDTDARLSFERHATSKISQANDLFSIRTMGFRGEALASIAAIAHVELKSKLSDATLGTQLIIEGSEVKSQQACQTAVGTSISVKNLFFNVPARRNFLKSDMLEANHILEEFYRLVLIHPEIAFSYHHNGKLIHQLDKSNLKQRIVNVFGKSYAERLIPVEQENTVARFSGFIGKPEFARKTRGEQYFFVNHRFFKHNYFHHAVDNAFQDILPEKAYPTYFINFDIDPKEIDINIHPTKTEIKFQDEKMMYAMLRSVVKQSIGKFSISPSIDFEVEQSLNLVPPPKGYEVKLPSIKINPDFNPFDDKNKRTYTPPEKTEREIRNQQNWERLFDDKKADTAMYTPKAEPEQAKLHNEMETSAEPVVNYAFFQLQHRYIITSIKSGLVIIDQQAAHERILYEDFVECIEQHNGVSQQQLFPQTIVFTPSDGELIKEMKTELLSLGFDINDSGSNTFIVNGIPANMADEDIKGIIEGMLENFRMNLLSLKVDKKINLALSMARNMAIKPGKPLMQEEMQHLIDRLFACKMPYQSPSGKKVLVSVTLEDISAKFKN
ncbi:MAG: DNA mismatch repair endonuclease MutL [Bacteroidetes bacterium]|nr:DNA mismatch repair endonuclease MutL [Bacteroidota bacterium]